MTRRRTRNPREINQEQPSATIPLIPQKESKSVTDYCTWDLALIFCVIFSAAGYLFLYIFLNPTVERLPPIAGPEFDTKSWGSYRPHLYFGLRTRSPISPLFGMMWYQQPDSIVRPNIHHRCAQNAEILKYGWIEADGRTFGIQNITERDGQIRTSWFNEHNGGGFSARVNLSMAKGKRYNVVFYMAAPDGGSMFKLGKHLKNIFYGKSDLLGDFKLSVNMKTGTNYVQTHSTILTNENVPIERFHDFIMENTQVYDDPKKPIHYLLNSRHNKEEGRFIVLQLNVGNEAEFDLSFVTGDKEPIIFENYNREIEKKSRLFNRKYESVFGIANKNYTEAEQQMGKVALSNMLGGIGFWNGMAKVTVNNQQQFYGPLTLFSAVPSRPFFPRGFLWDEGFHNMLIRKFDPKLTLEITVSWMNLMDFSGWIPREVILGPEAEEPVPAEYISQRPDVANPPSFFYVVDKLVHDEKVIGKYGSVLARLYPRLEKWFTWLRTTQYGASRAFRWRGRNETTVRELNPKTMSSGLDDYPRASHPTTEEYHLDLRCWLALCARVMERLSKHFGTDADHRKFSRQMEELNDFEHIKKDHWSEEHGGFFDYGKHSEDVALAKIPTPGKERPFEYERVTSRAPTYKLVTNVYGYNSLFPLMLKMIPANSRCLKAALDQIRDPKVLWTRYGLRSLSRSSPYYGARNTEHDPPYWRGYIWININYMTLSALKYYSEQSGPYKEQAGKIFLELRANLVKNMGKEFQRTGYIWENYDDKTGEGRGSRPFNGWSSLILMIMSDNLET